MLCLFETEGHPIVEQAHPGMPLYDGVQVASIVAQDMGQLPAGKPPVGILQQAADAQEEQVFRAGTQVDRCGVKAGAKGIQIVTEQPFQVVIGSWCGRLENLRHPLHEGINGFGAALAALHGEQILIFLAHLTAHIGKHKADDRVFFQMTCRFKQWVLGVLYKGFDKIHRQPYKTNFGCLDKMFGVQDAPVDETAGSGTVQIFLVFDLLDDLSFQHKEKLKIVVVVRRPGVEGPEHGITWRTVLPAAVGRVHPDAVMVVFRQAGAGFHCDLHRGHDLEDGRKLSALIFHGKDLLVTVCAGKCFHKNLPSDAKCEYDTVLLSRCVFLTL